MAAIDVDTTLSLAHLLTLVTVGVSVATLIAALRKDRRTREREIADRVRLAAASTLVKLSRWEELALWYYRDVQPAFVEITESLSTRFDVREANDVLWKRLTAIHVVAAERILKEDVERAYVDFYAYSPSAYPRFVDTMTELKSLEFAAFKAFVQSAQQALLAYENRADRYEPFALGNDLRGCAVRSESQLKRALDTVTSPMHEFLLSVVAESDPALLQRTRLAPAPAPRRSEAASVPPAAERAAQWPP